jgi:hypothetical protein
MAFSVSGLGAWVNENSQTLISKAVLELVSTKYFTIMPGVKYKEAIKFLATESPLVAAACGTPTTTGTTTITDKDIEVKGFMTFESLCPADLEKKSLQLSMSPGWNEKIPFEAQYADLKVKEIQKQIELKLWSITGATQNGIDGLIFLFDNDADVHDETFCWSATGHTASNFLSAVYAMQNALPAEIQSYTDLTLFVGHEISRQMLQQFVIANLYHIDMTNQDINSSWSFPGSNIKVQPVNGLNGLGRAVLTPASNLIYATDMMNEEEKFQLWWSIDDQLVKFLVNFKIGVNYYFGDYVVLSQC